MSTCVRKIKVEDYKAIHELNVKLGYDSNEEKVKRSIISLVEAGTDIILVAEKDGMVVGYVHGCPYRTLYTENLLTVVQYVFKTEYRFEEELKQELLDTFEARAKKNGYQGIRMTPNTQRELLMKLFEENGYVSKRDLKHFIKYF